jgi:DinB superfamily
MTDATLRSDLQESRDRLFAQIRGLSEEQFRYVPGGESWSMATHLAHLLRTERVFTERAGRALLEDNPAIPSTRTHNDDNPALAQRLAIPQIIHGMQAARRDLDTLLAGCDEAALDRGMEHERLGHMTVRDIAVKMSAHEDEHASAVARLVRQAPSSGRVIIPLSRRS